MQELSNMLAIANKRRQPISHVVEFLRFLGLRDQTCTFKTLSTLSYNKLSFGVLVMLMMVKTRV